MKTWRLLNSSGYNWDNQIENRYTTGCSGARRSEDKLISNGISQMLYISAPLLVVQLKLIIVTKTIVYHTKRDEEIHEQLGS